MGKVVSIQENKLYNILKRGLINYGMYKQDNDEVNDILSDLRKEKQNVSKT